MSVREIIKKIAAAAAVMAMLSCAHDPASAPQGAEDTSGPSRLLKSLRVVDSADRIRVEVEGEQPLAYDLSTNVVPATVLVDFPGFAKGPGLEKVDVNQAPLLQVVPSEVSQPRGGVQLIFRLSTAVEPDVKVEGARLVLEFPKGPHVVAAARAAESQPVSEESANPAFAEARQGAAASVAVSAEAGIQAKTMSRLEVRQGDGQVAVIIHGDGVFTYDVKPLYPDRLIIDLAHVETPLRQSVLPVEHPLLKQIRIGRHAEKIRVVLDLPRRSDFSVQPGTHSLIIQLASVPGAGSINGPMDEAGKSGEGAGGERFEPATRPGSQPEKSLRIASAGSVPFPERLARLETVPQVAQMAPEAKGAAEADEVSQPRFVGRRISLDFQAADIANVLRLIADVSGFNIVVGEGVKSKVTLKLVGVPWDQALDMLLKMNNLGMIREGNIVWIDTLANIARQQDEEAKAKESKIKAEDLVTRIIYVKHVLAQEIQLTLKQYLSPRGQLQVNQATNTLVVQDTESRLAAFVKLVEGLDVEVPQIQIEARIVQADTTYGRSLGVKWGVQNLSNLPDNRVMNFRGQAGSTDAFGAQAGNFLVNLPARIDQMTTVPEAGFTFGRLGGGLLLDMRLSAGESLGLVKIIAAPKITTLDKREAKIETGESIPYQTTSLQGTQTTFVDALLSLQVTPIITSRDPKETGKQVLLKIRATRNALGASQSPAGPSIAKREAMTQVLVRDGETMVIGGIIEDTQSNQVQGIPFLSRIPVIGWLFKNKIENVQKRELLIFLTPSIVKS